MEMIVLYFEYCTLTFHTSSEWIRGRRIDLSQFGKFIRGEGPDWELIMMGQVSIQRSPNEARYR
jgi:hypothetical protein